MRADVCSFLSVPFCTGRSHLAGRPRVRHLSVVAANRGTTRDSAMIRNRGGIAVPFSVVVKS